MRCLNLLLFYKHLKPLYSTVGCVIRLGLLLISQVLYKSDYSYN